MARHKEYVKEEVLEAATQVFWENGYEGTSVNELVEATGLHRRSMYEEFEDKDGLFLECLDHFVHETTKDVGVLLKQKPLGFQNIESFFSNRVDYVASRQFKGCLLVKSAVEKELLKTDAQKKVQYFLALTEKAFYECLQAAQERAEIHKDSDCKILAKYLMCFLEGLMVMGQTTSSKQELRRVVETVLSTVKR
jgi:TetR/AcrR family transcriptional repressor of nem operon